VFGNLVVTGMMGTGKSAVASLIATETGRDLVDLDDRIEAGAGASAAEIFASEGEDGFRDRERAAVSELGRVRDSVIATGGWTMADDESRATLESLGPVVCLVASAEAVAGRLAADARERPVLGSAPDLARVESLIGRRRSTYDSFVLQVDTTARTARESAAEVQALVESAGSVAASAIPVASPTGGYRDVVGSGLLDAIGPVLSAVGLAERVAIVTDDNVNALYGAKAMHSLEGAGAVTARVEFPAGEASKNLSTVGDLYNALVAAGLDRTSTVVALGGGVVGDAAGFVAATYLRGLSLVQVPTSLLAMVDSSVGGKTGVNLPAGKNLVGAFKHPDLVITDPSALRTLPPEELTGGMAEVVKAAVIGDPELLAQLEDRGAPDRDRADDWARIIRRAVAVKAQIVGEDPGELGRRVVLNLGHTFAHALEHATGHRIAHGPAVSVGLVAAARLAARTGYAQEDLAEHLGRILRHLGLPTRYAGPEPEALVRSMQADKKRERGNLRFVLPAAVGDVALVTDVAESDVIAVLGELRDPASMPPTVPDPE
jgi:3-dehydroquinate synthase